MWTLTNGHVNEVTYTIYQFILLILVYRSRPILPDNLVWDTTVASLKGLPGKWTHVLPNRDVQKDESTNSEAMQSSPAAVPSGDSEASPNHQGDNPLPSSPDSAEKPLSVDTYKSILVKLGEIVRLPKAKAMPSIYSAYEEAQAGKDAKVARMVQLLSSEGFGWNATITTNPELLATTHADRQRRLIQLIGNQTARQQMSKKYKDLVNGITDKDVVELGPIAAALAVVPSPSELAGRRLLSDEGAKARIEQAAGPPAQ
jgi:hypothetical protein